MKTHVLVAGIFFALTGCSGAPGEGSTDLAPIGVQKVESIGEGAAQVDVQSAAAPTTGGGGGRYVPSPSGPSKGGGVIPLAGGSGSPTYFNIFGTYDFAMEAWGSYACVLQGVEGSFASTSDKVYMDTDSTNWNLHSRNSGSDGTAAWVECAPWSMFYNDVPAITLSGQWNWSVGSNGNKLLNLWNNDAWCYSWGTGGRQNYNYNNDVTMAFDSGNPWQLWVGTSDQNTGTFGQTGCFKFSSSSKTVHPTITQIPYVDSTHHSQTIPSATTALCGLQYFNGGAGGFTNPSSYVYINTNSNVITNSSGDGNWPIVQADCISFNVP